MNLIIFYEMYSRLTGNIEVLGGSELLVLEDLRYRMEWGYTCRYDNNKQEPRMMGGKSG